MGKLASMPAEELKSLRTELEGRYDSFKAANLNLDMTRGKPSSDFHGHRPAVYINQHLLWYLMSVLVRHLNRTFGSSHSASSAYQKWPTGHSHSLPGSNRASQTSYPFKV